MLAANEVVGRNIQPSKFRVHAKSPRSDPLKKLFNINKVSSDGSSAMPFISLFMRLSSLRFFNPEKSLLKALSKKNQHNFIRTRTIGRIETNLTCSNVS
ncbi:hypothetical protein V6N12_017816 [Hibiscus sabdariffa]|uniref:Uncharacterized protein n=1 Tax=Hibiscus sabdariffa TaxID=183260 RepID=A0ABR2BCF0_9ROSI